MLIHWHLRITLESSIKQRAEELARADRRSAANFVGVIVEKYVNLTSTGITGLRRSNVHETR